MRSIPNNATLSCGVRFTVETSVMDEIGDVCLFEMTQRLSPGQRYTMRDRWGGDEDLVYLGHGWSVCRVSGSERLTVLPSFEPHYFTAPNATISDEAIRELMYIVNSKYEVDDGYETDV